MSEVIYKLDRLEDDARDRLEKEGRIIVRCADCRHCQKSECGFLYCALRKVLMFETDADGFCHKGERRCR